MFTARKVQSPTRHRQDSGNAIILALLLLSFLAALASAQFAIAQKNSRSSSYFLAYTDLHECAESGIGLAVHDLKYNTSGNSGKIGTIGWTAINDTGRDGQAGTYDEGEGDGIPTVGEANVAPVSMGGSSLGAGLIAYVEDSAYANVKRVVATASNQDASATISTFVLKTTGSVPKVGAVFVDPDVALDLKGNSFLIDGNDHKPDGTAGTEPPVPGIATSIGSPAGSNEAYLLAQIPATNYNQVQGLGGAPSLDEAGGVDLPAVFESFKATKTQSLAPAAYTSPTMGTPSAMEITYVGGDLQLAGKGKGAGVLVVEGSVTITGQFDFEGLVIVLGDVRLSGGGAGVHIYGSLMVGESLTAVDSDDSEVTVSGTADILYSSEVLKNVDEFLGSSYSVIYYDDK